MLSEIFTDSTLPTKQENQDNIMFAKKSLLMIDNYDSFTYNLVQYFQELGIEVVVAKNDAITLTEIAQQQADYLVISPGPCSPNEAGISLAAIKTFAGKLPILGVCLGHQCLAQAYGGRIVRTKELMHGKTSQIHHSGIGVFTNLPSPYNATRYHSLSIAADSLPKALEISAWTQDDKGEIDVIMGIKHKNLALEGVQFHPESILCEHGHDLLRNFLRQYSPDYSSIDNKKVNP